MSFQRAMATNVAKTCRNLLCSLPVAKKCGIEEEVNQQFFKVVVEAVEELQSEFVMIAAGSYFAYALNPAMRQTEMNLFPMIAKSKSHFEEEEYLDSAQRKCQAGRCTVYTHALVLRRVRDLQITVKELYPSISEAMPAELPMPAASVPSTGQPQAAAASRASIRRR